VDRFADSVRNAQARNLREGLLAAALLLFSSGEASVVTSPLDLTDVRSGLPAGVATRGFQGAGSP